MKFILQIIIYSILLSSCSEKIINGNDLPSSTISHIKKLGILDNNEQILYFYSSLNNRVSGNFITKKRIASYWQNKTSNENYIKQAYYDEIKSITINHGDGFEFSSAFIIELNNGQNFNVYFNDNRENINKLYNELLNIWKP